MLVDLLDRKEKDNFFDRDIIKFATNCQNFKLSFGIGKKIQGNYPHVGVTAREGILVLYKYPDKNIWFNLDVYARRNPIPVNMNNYSIKKHITDNSEFEIMIMGPIFGEISKLTLELPETSYFLMNNHLSERKIVFAGGVHSYGIGCTSVGLMFSNILIREFDASKMDVTFNNRKSHLKDIYDYYSSTKNIPNVNIGVLEVDCFEQDIEILKKYLNKTVKIMKKHCNHIICWFCLPDIKLTKKKIIFELLKDEIDNNNISLLDMSFIYDDEYSDMCTFSNNFINDTGNIFIYKKLKEAIQGVTKWNI